MAINQCSLLAKSINLWAWLWSSMHPLNGSTNSNWMAQGKSILPSVDTQLCVCVWSQGTGAAWQFFFVCAMSEFSACFLGVVGKSRKMPVEKKKKWNKTHNGQTLVRLVRPGLKQQLETNKQMPQQQQTITKTSKCALVGYARLAVALYTATSFRYKHSTLPLPYCWALYAAAVFFLFPMLHTVYRKCVLA